MFLIGWHTESVSQTCGVLAVKKRREKIKDNQNIKDSILIEQAKYIDIRCGFNRCTHKNSISTYGRYIYCTTPKNSNISDSWIVLTNLRNPMQINLLSICVANTKYLHSVS